MKLTYALLFILIISGNIFAQNFEDAWRYSQDNPYGTARFTAMSGAFSSLGGDLSAIGLNPAGTTTFATNRMTGTFSFYNTQNNTNYFGQNTSANYTSFDDRFLGIDQIGAVWVFKSEVNDWNKIALAINYNKDADYGNYFIAKGLNTAGHSVTNYFVDNANGVALADIKLIDGFDEDYKWLGENLGFNAQQAYLGYQAYVINAVDPNDDTNMQYTPNAVYSQVYHENTLSSSGRKSHIDFNIAGTYQHKLQLGFSLTAYSIDYAENNTITESGYDASSDLQYLKFRNSLRVEGSGLALKFGAIYKIAQGIKLSLAYHSPQWLEINEYLKQGIHTEMGNGDVFDIQPTIENAFAPYKIITPSKVIIGASALINKRAVISGDYTYQNMSHLHFKEKDKNADTSYFDAINASIANDMQPVHQLSLGGELKFNQLFLRAGTYTATSPVKGSASLFSKYGYSFGAGYNFGMFVIDAAFMQSHTEQARTLLGLPDQSVINGQTNRYVIGIRYNF